jgi:cadmium resistance transport/sequestration family protein
MHWVLHTSLTAITAFAATNVDDIVVLMLFFAQVNRSRPQALDSKQIILGQYLGFTALLLASLPGYLGGLVLPKPWIGLLGILPIVIGIRAFKPDKDKDDRIQTVNLERLERRWLSWVDTKLLQVAAVTFANGGDNIGIYVPLFAKSNAWQLGMTVVIFFSLVGVWCGIAYGLSRHPHIGPRLNRSAHRLVPVVLIGLGIYIFLESGSWQLFSPGA